MLRTGALSIGYCTFALALMSVGCGPDAKDQKIADLTSENDQLKGELEDRDRKFNDALVRQGDSQSTIDELNQQLAKLRAGQGKEGDWVTMPSFDMISVPGSVLFDSGKADLTAAGRAKLAQISSDIRSRYSDRDIYVFGHTDNQPIRKSKWKDNWELGAHRSLSVIRAMRDLGIPNESLVQANCGEYRPKLANSNDRNRFANRRVEFYAVKKGGSALDVSTALRSTSDE
jgi:chemotaxis protein MotB